MSLRKYVKSEKVCFSHFFRDSFFQWTFFYRSGYDQKLPNYLLELHAKFYVCVLVYNRDIGIFRIQDGRQKQKKHIFSLIFALYLLTNSFFYTF